MLDSNRISISFLIPEGEEISDAEIALLASITEEISVIIKEFDQIHESLVPKRA